MRGPKNRRVGRAQPLCPSGSQSHALALARPSRNSASPALLNSHVRLLCHRPDEMHLPGGDDSLQQRSCPKSTCHQRALYGARDAQSSLTMLRRPSPSPRAMFCSPTASFCPSQCTAWWWTLEGLVSNGLGAGKPITTQRTPGIASSTFVKINVNE